MYDPIRKQWVFTKREHLPEFHRRIHEKMDLEEQEKKQAKLKVVKDKKKKDSKSYKISDSASKKAEEFTQQLHLEDDGLITMLRKYNKYDVGLRENVATGTKDHEHYFLDELTAVKIQKLVKKTTDTYISINSFYIAKRSVHTLRRINALYVDIDKHDGKKVSKDEMKALMDYYKREVWGKSLPEPHMIVSTGRGVQIYWLLENLPKQGLPFWTVMQNKIAQVMEQNNFNGFTLDWNCVDVTRVFRLPGTNNSKTNTQANVIFNGSSERYTLDSIAQDYFPKNYMSPKRKEEWKKEKAEKKTKETPESKMFNSYSLHLARLEDIRKLQEIRTANGDNCEGLREFMCFLHRYYSCFAIRDLEVALQDTLDFNSKFLLPLPIEEVEIETRSAEKAYAAYEEQLKEMARNKELRDSVSTKNKNRKGYNYRTQTLVKKLNITVEESKYLTNLIRSEEKQARNTVAKREARRDSGGLTARERSKLVRIVEVLKAKERGLSQSKAAEELGVGIATVKRYWNESMPVINIEKVLKNNQKTEEITTFLKIAK